MSALHLPEQVTIRDVGPRDGLQPEQPVPVADRVRLVRALLDAGLTHVEIAAFVSPRAVPTMAGAAEVVASVPPREGLVRTALVPNIRGATDALGSGVEELTVTISISEAYNRANVGMSTEESENEIVGIVEAAEAHATPVDAVISCAFGSPDEGDIAPRSVRAIAERLRASGVSTITLADTTGMATPRRIHDVVDAFDDPADLGLHLHDTRGLAIANAYAGLLRGITRYDTAVGGFGGSPFARGAGGNLATEQLVVLCEDLGVRTGIDVGRLLDAATLIGELVEREPPSMVARHGPPRVAPGA